MAKPKNKTQRLMQVVLTIFVIVGIGLIIADLAGNISYELSSDTQMESAAQELEPTPRPTLTEAERQEIFNAPVGEEGDD